MTEETNKKQEIEIKLVKINDNKFHFLTETDKFKRIEEVDKKNLKELYEESEKELQKYMEQLGSLNKEIEKLEIEKNDELEKFIELANKAAQYNNYMKKVEARSGLIGFIERIKKGRDDVLKVAPEFGRGKK